VKNAEQPNIIMYVFAKYYHVGKLVFLTFFTYITLGLEVTACKAVTMNNFKISDEDDHAKSARA